MDIEKLIRNVIKEALEDAKILLSPKLFLKFGYCFEVYYNVQDSFLFPGKADSLNDYTRLLTDKSAKMYSRLKY